MTMTRRITALARPTTGLARIGRRVADVVAEIDYAQRRMFTLMTTPDAYITDRDRAPDSYAEFLYRTSSPLLHEPTAADRADRADRTDQPRGRRAA
jgi:hypothetical protein